MNTCYNSGMPIFEGKRLETVPVKFNDAEKQTLQKIHDLEDRPLGYIVRELCWRGFLGYLKDKRLKVTAEEIEEAKNLILDSDSFPMEPGVQDLTFSATANDGGEVDPDDAKTIQKALKGKKKKNNE